MQILHFGAIARLMPGQDKTTVEKACEIFRHHEPALLDYDCERGSTDIFLAEKPVLRFATAQWRVQDVIRDIYDFEDVEILYHDSNPFAVATKGDVDELRSKRAEKDNRPNMDRDIYSEIVGPETIAEEQRIIDFLHERSA